MGLLGDSISLECWLDPYIREVTWQQGSREIFIHQNLQDTTIRTENSIRWFSEIDINQLRSTLVIKHVQYNDSGSYSCKQHFERVIIKISTYVLHVQGR
ncbi:hypothetical protein HOLleu_22355 [Holothuria leucospilota]|uniref:Ig-like domain-containing protein n=1 Tax=Holothuria leucospilota TaxID=206669 RepID=A0A9Q1BYG8_HOLLE|nr:hypothetical protein HOLleu_22355 [Holothuria leucospilota]